MSREAIQCDYSWGLLSFVPQTNLRVSRKRLHLLQSPLNRFSRTSQTLCHWHLWVRMRHQGKGGVHMWEHMLYSRLWVCLFLHALLLDPLLFIFYPNSCLFHITLRHPLHPWPYPYWRWTLLPFLLPYAHLQHSFSPSVTTWGTRSELILAVSLLAQLFPLHAPMLP